MSDRLIAVRAITGDGEQKRRKQPGRLRSAARELRGRRRLFLGTTALLWLIGAAVTFSLPERYAGVSKLLVHADMHGGAPTTSADPLAGAIESEIEILQSRGLAERVIAQLKLYEDPELNPSAPDRTGNQGWLGRAARWASALFASKNKGPTDTRGLERLRTQIINRFLSHLRVERLGHSRVVSITYSSGSPERAAAVANTIAERHVRERMEARLDRDKKTADWVTKRLASLREDAETSERHLAALRRDADIAAERAARIEELTRQLTESESTRAKTKSRLDEAEALLHHDGPSAAAAVLWSETLRWLRNREEKVQRRIAEMTVLNGARSPELAVERQKLAEVRDRIAAEVKTILNEARTEIRTALTRENVLRLTRDRLVRQTPPDAEEGRTRLVSMEHEATAKRAEYEAVLAQVNDAHSDQKGGPPPAWIISRADVPVEPFFPDIPLFLTYAAAIALAGGIIVVILASWCERGFRSLQQIEDEAGLPTIGLVPAIPGLRRSATDPTDYIIRNPGSAFGESVRAIHTGILLSNVETPPKLMLVSSSVPNEGKTSLAICFARLVSQVGRKKVVLVDCDLRNPEVHQKLYLPQTPGLAEYLRNEATLEDILQVDYESGAMVIAAGEAPTNTTDLLTSPRLRDLLTKLSEVCDMVVLDSSPVLAVSDGRILSRLVDRTIFVARWARTPRETVMRGVKEIVDAGGILAGVALTRVDLRAHARYGFGDSDFYHESYRKYYSN